MCFHSLWADIFTNCFVAWAFWPISTWITLFKHISSIHVNMITVCECVCVVPCLRFLCSTEKNCVYFSSSSSSCYLTSSGPLTNRPNGEKIEHFIGTPVRTPPGFMANRQCLLLSWERQNKERVAGRGRWGEEKQGKEQRDPNLHVLIGQLKLTGIISGKLCWSYYTVHILNTFAGQTSATGDVCWIYYVNCSRPLETNCTFLLVCKRQSQRSKHNFCRFDWSTMAGNKVLSESLVMHFFACLHLWCWKSQ